MAWSGDSFVLLSTSEAKCHLHIISGLLQSGYAANKERRIGSRVFSLNAHVGEICAIISVVARYQWRIQDFRGGFPIDI